jgi:hypothetical protein
MSLLSKIKKGVKKTIKVTKMNAKIVGSGAKKVAQKVAQGGTFLALKPFEGMMRNTLRAAGYAVPSGLENLAKAFYQNIVQRNAYDESVYFNDGSTLGHISSDQANSPYNGIDPITITAIVSGILTYIKKVRDKKANGEPLTNIQKTVAAQAENVERESDAIIDAETKRTVGDLVMQYWWIAALVLAGLAFAAYSKKGK